MSRNLLHIRIMDWAVLATIEQWYEKYGRAPSYREIANACGWASLSTVVAYLRRLERQGFISREPGRQRMIVPHNLGGEDGK